MRLTFCFLLVTLLPRIAHAQDPKTAFKNALIKYSTEVDCEKEKLIGKKGFHLVTQDIFSKIAPDVTADAVQGSSFAISFEESETKAAAQGSFAVKGGFLNFGVNTALKENTYDIISGTKISPDWGVKVGYTRRINIKVFGKSPNSIFYKSKSYCEQFHLNRQKYLDTISRKYYKPATEPIQDIQKAFDENNNQINKYRQSGEWVNDPAENAKLNKLIADNIELGEILQKVDEIYPNDSMKYQVQRSLKDNSLKTNKANKKVDNRIDMFIAKKIAEYEKANAKITGYSMLLYNLNFAYNSKNYGTYTSLSDSIDNRFDEIAFHNWNLSGTVSYFRQAKFYVNANLTFGYGNLTSFDLPGNKKHHNTYNVQSTQPTPNDQSGTLITSEEKKAINTDSVQFKKFNAFSTTLQGNMLFGERKNLGFAASIGATFSDQYTTGKKIDLAVGPLFAVVGKDDEVSKLNFGFYFGFKDLSNSSTEYKEKFNVSFFARVPIKIIKF